MEYGYSIQLNQSLLKKPIISSNLPQGEEAPAEEVDSLFRAWKKDTPPVRMGGIMTGGENMDSVYKIIELVGTSSESWEKAATNAVERASKTLRDIRVAEVCLLDMAMENGKVKAYRAKVKISFKFED